jgi:hypothetical protein
MLIKNKLFQLLAVAAGMMLVLYFMGRIPWCACGEYYLWSSDVNSTHNSQHLLDPYSFSHFQHGLFFYFLLSILKFRSFLFALILEAAWEITENSPFIIERYRSATFSLHYYGDSIFNSLGDLLSCALGFYLTSRLPWKLMLFTYVAVEVGMLIVIKDSLTLNVIMLIHPIDAIRNWQTGG